MKTKNKTFRQKGALERLEEQLRIGTKINKETKEHVPLSESDIKRIQKEIDILSEKK